VRSARLKNSSCSYDAKNKLTNYNGRSISYDASGIRTSKTSNGVTTKYYLNGTNIIEQTDGIDTLHFYYDGSNELIGFNHNGKDYFYIKNQQGDITDITNSNGEIVASYEYDPWGAVISVSDNTYLSIGTINPFRYRSYYYDYNIDMYYLNSRYYDPETGRFINCDDVSYIGASGTEIGYNAFAYCENDAVNNIDPNGFWGADIHYGRKYTTKKYVNSKKVYTVYDGTYEWARESGWTSTYSNKLANACRNTDRKKGVGFVWCWKYHFNTNKSGIDSREQIYEDRLEESIKKFKAAKNDKQRYSAIEILGERLHALQDYYAHGSFYLV